MTARSAARRDGDLRGDRARGASIALVYGESQYDAHAIRELIEALAPDWRQRVQARRDPPIEVKNAKLSELPRRSDRLMGAIAVEQVARDVVCVFAHEDCDDVEPAHQSLTERIESAFADIGTPVYAVTPAWETEAWWFQWPDAVAAIRSSWRAPKDYVGKNVGVVRDAKEKLKKAVIPAGLNQAQKRRFRSYQESDAPTIARSVRDRAEAAAPMAKSESFDWFATRVQQSCAHSKR